MRDETRELVQAIDAAQEYQYAINRVRDLWNYRDHGEDCDIELRINSYIDVKEMIDTVGELDDWYIRFINTPDPHVDYHLSVALIHSEADVGDVHSDSPNNEVFWE